MLATFEHIAVQRLAVPAPRLPIMNAMLWTTLVTMTAWPKAGPSIEMSDCLCLLLCHVDTEAMQIKLDSSPLIKLYF